VLDIRTPRLQRLYQDWHAWRGERAFPSRRDFDPVDLGYILGKLSLVSVLYEPLRFRYRVHATELAERLGFDLTGKELDALPDRTHRAAVREHFVAVVEHRAPEIRRRDRQRANGRAWRYEALVLPLSGNGETIDMLISAVEFT